MSLPILLFLFAAAPVAGAAGDGIHVKTLDNGLRIVVKEDHSKPLAALRIYVKTGGALEGEFLGCGISHYYEHLLSGGTTSTRSEAESARILQELGGQSNAYTAADHTCYHVVTHRDFIGKAIDLYGDWMMNNVLDPAEVEREKGVIVKEMNKGEDEPDRTLYLLFMKTMYRVHPCGIPNIGYRPNFLRITRDDLVRFYRNRYAPNNSVVAVAGDVDPEEIFSLVEKSMGAWERRPEPYVVLPEEPRQVAPRYAEKEMDVQQAMVRMGCHTFDLFHPDLYALDMVAAVLSNGRASRLHRKIVEELDLTDSIQAWSLTPNWRAGEFTVSFQVPVEKLEATIDAVKAEIERIKAGPVTEEELERAKVQVVSQHQLNRQTVQDQAAEVGSSLLGTGDPRFNQKYTDRIQDVTPEQVVAAARKWLDPNGLTVAVVRPLRHHAADTGETAETSEAKVEVRRTVLANGLTLLVKRTPGVAPVGIETFVHGGLRAEPAGENGLSFLTGRLLLRGTKTRSAQDIAREVEEIGGAISSQSGNNTIGLSLTLARGSRDLAFASSLLADILGNATWPAEEFEKEKNLVAMVAGRQDDNWQTETIDFMRREIWGDHPYAGRRLGTPESVSALTRDDVLAFAKRCIRPEGMVVAVAGDVDLDETTALFSAALGKLSAEGDYVVPNPPPPAWAKGSFPEDSYAFKENDKKQATLAIAFPCPPYLNLEDRAAFLVVDAFTSGIGLPSGWFHNALRGGERSYVYFVHFSLMSFLRSGCCFVYTQTQPDLLEEVYGILLGQIDKLRRGEFTDQELAIGRAMALVSGPYYSQTVSDVAQEVALSDLYGAGYDFPERFQAAVKKVTREDVMRVVDRYLRKKLVVVTGPKEVCEIFERMKSEK